jgi:hypothetical protein
MKNFISENWYKLMIGSSLMMASFGFMVNSISPAMANSKKEEILNDKFTLNKKGISPSVKVNGPSETYYLIDSKNNVWWYQDGGEWTYWTTLYK